MNLCDNSNPTANLYTTQKIPIVMGGGEESSIYYFKKTKQLLGCFLIEVIKHFNIDKTFLIFRKHFSNYKVTNLIHNSDSLTSKQTEFNPRVVSQATSTDTTNGKYEKEKKHCSISSELEKYILIVKMPQRQQY